MKNRNSLFVAASTALLLTPAILAQERPRTKPGRQAVLDVVEDELASHPAVEANDIDVRWKDDTLTLSGEVDSILERSYARRLAEAVRGVQELDNQVEVKPYWGLLDREIEKFLDDALLLDPVTEAFEIDTEVVGGHAILSGTVDSRSEKEAASRVARGVRGVVDVRNQLEVEQKPERPDMEISREIQQRLLWDVLVDDGLIEVAVDDGKVFLSGTVGSAAEKSRATADAWVDGVVEVENGRLAVSMWARDGAMTKDRSILEDDAIAAAVQRNLRYDALTDSTDVEVSVDSFVATLRGEVGSLRARRHAEDIAMDTYGVGHVENRLKVRSRQEEPTSDARIENRLAAAFLRDPYLERFEIDIDVIDGTAYLDGLVDSFFEKSRAETVASTVASVTAIRNRLDVHDSSVLVYDPFLFDPYLQHRSWYDYEPKTTEFTDRRIAEEVEDQIWWSPFVDSEDVDVVVEDGTATLRGTVDSWSERYAATENAFEGGASWVRNLLDVEMEVEGSGTDSDGDQQ